MVEEEFLGLFGQSFERGRREILFFTLKNVFIIYRYHSLIENPLLVLSATFRAKRNSSRVGIALSVLVMLSEMSKSIIL